MAAGNFQAYEKGLLAMLDGSVDFDTDVLQAILLTNAHTVDVVNDQFVSNVTAEECADGDYARQAIAGNALSIVSGAVRFDCNDIDFGNTVTISARYLVIAKDTNVDASDQLLFICDLNTGGGNLSSTSGDFDITINASGIYNIDANP